MCAGFETFSSPSNNNPGRACMHGGEEEKENVVLPGGGTGDVDHRSCRWTALEKQEQSFDQTWTEERQKV